MSKRTASSAASDLIERLMPLRDNRGELHEALASFDTVLVGDAIAQLLAIAASVEGNLQKRRKLVSTIRTRACDPPPGRDRSPKQSRTPKPKNTEV